MRSISIYFLSMLVILTIDAYAAVEHEREFFYLDGDVLWVTKCPEQGPRVFETCYHRIPREQREHFDFNLIEDGLVELWKQRNEELEQSEGTAAKMNVQLHYAKLEHTAQPKVIQLMRDDGVTFLSETLDPVDRIFLRDYFNAIVKQQRELRVAAKIKEFERQERSRADLIAENERYRREKYTTSQTIDALQNEVNKLQQTINQTYRQASGSNPPTNTQSATRPNRAPRNTVSTPPSSSRTSNSSNGSYATKEEAYARARELGSGYILTNFDGSYSPLIEDSDGYLQTVPDEKPVVKTTNRYNNSRDAWRRADELGNGDVLDNGDGTFSVVRNPNK